MPGFVVRVLISALALWLASAIVPGVEVRSVAGLLFAALLLGIVNALVRPLVVLLTLPLTLLTLGLFLLVINAGMLQLVDWFIDDFVVNGFFPAIFAAIIVSLTSMVASWYVGPKAKYELLVVRKQDRD